ncbi:hypothetical protein CONPUDRAFT_147088 [Coniophora puteana RWD-64-598 SS2]|uniref:GST N-terminal domain-containing protein n=1 Tax=Coniophora puteana (strain RWD-64-598) TaxID=741705 RepID=A0A5M3M975_CONPW|nr:uncharacterized protein CONPUDRAFT_147088 [Coniophora puteana RWD-64-598 SS2]EIW75404.1 hypothetical protein CONPUDRAFT_147088 [Coniophora puteana RWD-64-598 SS2]
MPEQLTYYGNKTAIALQEANAKYQYFEIDFTNKPDWFVKVNPAGKVPAMTYGGPAVNPDQPSPESTKLSESAVLLEFIADLHPSSGLLPSDLVQRAKARFFTTVVDTVVAPAMIAWVTQCAPASTIVDAFKKLQELLPENGRFAVGDAFTIADAGFAPLYVRVLLSAEGGVHKGGKEHASGVLDALSSPELAKFKAYGDRLVARPSVDTTWDKEASAAYLSKLVLGN